MSLRNWGFAHCGKKRIYLIFIQTIAQATQMNSSKRSHLLFIPFAVLLLGFVSCSSPEELDFTPASAEDSVTIIAFYEKMETLLASDGDNSIEPDSACELTLVNKENMCVVGRKDLRSWLSGKAEEEWDSDPFKQANKNFPIEGTAWKTYTKEFAQRVKQIQAAKYFVLVETEDHEKPVQGENGFQTGVVSGCVVIYSYDDVVVQCRLPVYAENSEYVHTQGAKEAVIVDVELQVDLRMRAAMAVDNALEAVFGTPFR
jgi:hypothetical protein